MGQEDRKKNSVDRINQAHNAYQNARLLNALSKGRLGKGALSAARSAMSAARGVGALASTSEIWGPIAIAIIVIVVPTFLIVLGGQGQASETPPTDPQDISQNIVSKQSSDIVYWASQILNRVQPFPFACGKYIMNNVMLESITNGSYTATKRPGSACGLNPETYFCTTFVIDTYNLAGLKNGFSQYTGDMFNQWSSVAGLAVRNNNDVRGLLSGDAVFWFDYQKERPGQHVGLVSNINVDVQTGNGTLTTMDTNMNSKNTVFPVREFKLIGIFVGVVWEPRFGLGPR